MSHAKQVLKRKNVGACLNAGGAAVKDIVFTHSYVTLPVDKYADLHRNWLVRIFWCRSRPSPALFRPAFAEKHDAPSDQGSITWKPRAPFDPGSANARRHRLERWAG
jgi:hypothetical protein